jgi:predicted phage terminase large subunit-like protein
MRGLKYIHQRPTKVIYDDPEDENNTLTEEARDKTLNGLLKGIVPGLDPHYGRAGVIGTPIHSQGLVNTLESNPSWFNRKYKGLIENEAWKEGDPEKDRYRALWPEVLSVDRLLEDKASAEAIGKLSTWYSEYQCEIVGDEDQLFREADLRYWKGELQWDVAGNPYLEIIAKGDPSDMEVFVNPLKIPVNLFMGVDPASSTRRTADYSVIFTIGMDIDKNIYAIDYFRKRVKPLTLASEIIRKFKHFRPQRTQVESTGYQEMLRQYLREHAPEHIPGLEIKNSPRTKKSDRLAGLQPDFAMGKVYLRPHMQDFEQELLLFPRGRNDDLLDGFFYARKGAYIPYHEVQTDERPAERRVVPGFSKDWMVI